MRILFGKEINAMFIIAQIVGFCAMAFAIGSYQMRKRTSIIIAQNFSNAFWVIQYILLGAYSAVIVNIIAIIRNAVYAMRGKYKFADSILIPIIASVAFVISGVFTYQTPFDILPSAAMVIASFAFFMKNEVYIRYISLAIAAPWVIFSAYSGSIAGVLSDSITFISILVAIIRYRKPSAEKIEFTTHEEEELKSQSNAYKKEEI